MPVQIDGKKLIIFLGLSENGLTAQKVMDALLSLTEEERKAVMEECTIIVPDRLPLFSADLPEHRLYEPCHDACHISDTSVRKRLKYEKSYLAIRELRYRLGPGIGEHGKHSMGCKRKRKKNQKARKEHDIRKRFHKG